MNFLLLGILIIVVVVVIVIALIFVLLRRKSGPVGTVTGQGQQWAQTPAEAVQNAQVIDSEIQKQLEPIVPVETSSYYSSSVVPQPKSFLEGRRPKSQDGAAISTTSTYTPPHIATAQPINIQPQAPQVQVTRICENCGATVRGNYVCPFCGQAPPH